MTGSVTISLKDFQKLQKSQEETDERAKGVHQAAKELEVFLSFLISRESIGDHLKEFNRQSSTCSINILEGRAKIVFKNEKN